MARPFVVLLAMQLWRVGLALGGKPATHAVHVQTVPSTGSLFLDRQSPELELDPGELGKLNAQALAIRKKVDALELQCKAAQLKDKETIEGITRELRAVSTQLAGNVALQSGAANAADKDQDLISKLKVQLVNINSMCDTQNKALNATVGMLLRDKDKAKSLGALSSNCENVFISIANSPLPPATFLQGCMEEVAAPLLEAGEALVRQGEDLATPFAKQAFRDALQHASTKESFPALLASSKGWPSKSKPRSKAQAKAANACKVAKGSVNCAKMKAALDTLAKQVEDQKNAALVNQRRQMDQCANKVKKVHEFMSAANAQNARSSAELVRLTGIKAGLAASRATIALRLERNKRDARKFQATCKAGESEYKGRIDEILDKRKIVANRDAGYDVAIQDCKVSDWLFSKCSKPCGAGVMEATRSVAQVAGFQGTACPPLSAKLKCNDKPCPRNCLVSEWTKWSACSKACGGGTTARTRKVTAQAKDGGKACPVIADRKSCNVGSCSDVCKLAKWTPWTACSRRCKFSKNSAAGRQRRVRNVIGNPIKRGGGSPCPPANDKTRFQARKCNPEICPKGITCDASQDIVFLLDGSGAGGADFENQLALVASIIKASSKKVKFGVVSYGKKVQILSRITPDRNQLAAISVYTPPAGGSRDSAKAEVVGRTLFSDPGVGGGRPKIAVLLLGGAPAGFANAKKAAEEMRSAGVRLVVGLVDTGNQIARDQACALASKPCSANVEAVKSWQVMAQQPGRFLASICRDLVYPKKGLSPMDKLVAGRKKSRRKKKGRRGYKRRARKKMPAWMKRQLNIK